MTIPATSGASSLGFRDDRDDENGPPVETRPPRSHEPPAATRSRIDADILAFVRNAAPSSAPEPAAPPPPMPKSDRVLYVGMNDDSKTTEAGALRGGGASVTTVLRRDGTTVRLDGRGHDLAEREGCEAFAVALSKKHGLPSGAAEILHKALESVPPSARDELARIAMVLAPGECGAQIPSRLVFSGHSDGTDVHMGGESLKLDAVMAILRAMPDAARQVEDIHFSGCFTSAQIYAVDEWRSACPNLKSMWGYSGIAPGTPVGHLQSWERSTRGRETSDPVRGGRANITTWSVKEGIRTGVSLEQLRKDQASSDAIFGQLWGGDIQSGPWGQARKPYETYRELSYRPELSKQEQTIMRAKADVLLRIRFYETVRTELVNEHGPQVRDAFESLGLPVPDFTRLSRKEAVVAIQAFEAKARATSPLPEAAAKAEKLLVGFRKLDPAVIPSAWCH